MSDINLLSDREVEILSLLAKGKSNKEIAQELYISVNTVKVHLRNVFAKIEVSSRTEATLYAVRAGLVEGVLETNSNGGSAETSPIIPSPQENDSHAEKAFSGRNENVAENQDELPDVIWWRKPWLWGGVIVFLILVGVGLSRFIGEAALPVPETEIVPGENRWEAKEALPSERSGHAITVYENQIFVIGGETPTGIINSIESYTPETDRWKILPDKPTAVTDIQAKVLGGKIYVPGGKLESGQPIKVMEIYHPREEKWTQGASLPIPISAYAMEAFEGDLYLFGGWDGTEFTNLVLRYDPDLDRWNSLTPMKIVRGYAAATVLGGKIYVLGGYDGKNELTDNDIYSPELENSDISPWSSGTPLPEPRAAMGVANVAGNLYLIGGDGSEHKYFSQMKYSPNENTWEVTTNPLATPWTHMGVVSFGAYIYALGGRIDDSFTARNFVYQVIFSISIPIAP